jgi:hypothetical protein
MQNWACYFPLVESVHCNQSRRGQPTIILVGSIYGFAIDVSMIFPSLTTALPIVS